MTKKHINIPIFIPELACPFRCIYCNQQKISGAKYIPTPKEAESKIIQHLKTIDKSNTIVEVGFFGGSFTGIPLKEQEEYLNVVQAFIEDGSVNAIRLSTRPDYINEEILDFLKRYHVKTIELGAQSLNNDILKLSNRGHNVDDVIKASSLIKSYGFELGLQMMIGLPGDDKAKSIETAQKIIELKADNTRIYPTVVIKDTYLEELFKKGIYKVLTLEESIEILKEIIPMFENANVQIIRIGLHPSEELTTDAFIAGPFHPSIRELVETEIWYDLITKRLGDTDKNSRIRLIVSNKHFNFAIGYRAINKRKLEQKYKSLSFSKDHHLTNREFYAYID